MPVRRLSRALVVLVLPLVLLALTFSVPSRPALASLTLYTGLRTPIMLAPSAGPALTVNASAGQPPSAPISTA